MPNPAYHDPEKKIHASNGRTLPSFAPGNPGKPKGTKNKNPTGMKASVKHLIKQIVAADPEQVKRALIRGMKSSPRYSFHFLQLAAHYLDGRPVETIKMKGLEPAAPATYDYGKLNAEELKQLQALLAKSKVDEAQDDDEAVGEGADLAGETEESA